MRTGAIFARGSCRALKWMALVGSVFALGASQAVAQTPPTVVDASTYFDPHGTELTITLTTTVSGDPETNDFDINVDPDGAGTDEESDEVEVESVRLSGRTIILTAGEEFPTGSTVTVDYAQPTGEDHQIKNRADDAPLADFTAQAVLEGHSEPELPDVADRDVVAGKDIMPFTLPAADGGNGDLTYVLFLTGKDPDDAGDDPDLPTGLVWTAESRTVSGMVAEGEYNLVYRVAEAATITGTVAGAGGDNDRETFKLTAESDEVVPVGTMGEIVKTALVGNSLEVKTIGGTKRNHVPEGARDLQVEVTVEWTVKELKAIYGNSDKADPAEVTVTIQTDSGSTGEDWISWIDERQDVNFPDNRGLLSHTVEIKLPKKPKTTDRESDTHESTGMLDVDILHDDREAENDMFYIEVTASTDIDVTAGRSSDKRTLDTVIEDDDPQSVTVKKGTSKGPSTVYESDGEIEFTVAADPPRNELPLEVDLDMLDLEGTTVRAAKISVDTRRLELNADGDGSGNSATVTVHLPASDGDRENNDYQLQATVNPYSLASGTDTTVEPTSHMIKVVDVHKLPKLTVSPSTATLMEGAEEKTELTLTINRNPANTTVSSTEKLQYTQEPVTVMLAMGAGSTADASDYSIMPASVTFPERTRGSYMASMTVEVEALADKELDDMEMLVLDAEVDGTENAKHGPNVVSTDPMNIEDDMYHNVAMVTIEEGTMKYVWPKSDEEIQEIIYAAKEAAMGADMMFNPGEMIELESAGALFNAAEGVTLSYSAMSDNEDVAMASVSGGMVTVTAGDMPGVMAHITITAHASMPAGAKGLPQTDPREASVIFPVEVGLAALSIALSGPDDMNLVEGGMGGMVTATANRMVTEDTMVTLMRDRSMSSADDMDYTAEAITILAGQTSGSTMVMAVEDDVMETVDNMPEELVLYGMTEGMEGEVTGEVKFYLWDAAVPALPIIAQLLLAAFLAVGGYRRYLRR